MLLNVLYSCITLTLTTSFKEWSDRLTEKVEVQDGMDHVAQPEPDKPYMDCNCHRSDKTEQVTSLDARQEDLNARDEL
jgi:hypothetical protein